MASEASNGRLAKSPFVCAFKGAGREKIVVCQGGWVSCTSKSSLSLEATGLKFCLLTLYIYAKKVSNQIFKILYRGWDMRVFPGYAKSVPTGLAHTLIGIYMRSLCGKFQHSDWGCKGHRRWEGLTDARDTKVYHIPERELVEFDFFTCAFGGYAFFNVQKMHVYIIFNLLCICSKSVQLGLSLILTTLKNYNNFKRHTKSVDGMWCSSQTLQLAIKME